MFLLQTAKQKLLNKFYQKGDVLVHVSFVFVENIGKTDENLQCFSEIFFKTYCKFSENDVSYIQGLYDADKY